MKQFMDMAIKEAYKGIKKRHGGPFGAVIVKDGKVIATGHNKVVKTNDVTAHGEMVAIRKACKKLKTFDLSGCQLFTSAQPCPMCLSAILWANIDKVYYGCNTTDTGNIGFRDKIFEDNLLSKMNEMCEELSRDECLKLFEDYVADTKRTPY